VARPATPIEWLRMGSGVQRVRTVHPPSRPVPGGLPSSRDSDPALPRRLEVTA